MRFTLSLLAHVGLVVLLGGGCGSLEEERPRAERAEVGAGATPPVAAPIDADSVAVLVAHERFATLGLAQLHQGLRLDELIEIHPYTRWASLVMRGPGVPAPTTWLEPVSTMPGLVPLVYLDAGRPALALVDPSHPDPRGADLRVTGIDEIAVELARLPRTPEQALADGCQPEPDDGSPQPPVPRHWRGPSYQFVTHVHWRNDLTIELATSPAGDHVGTGTMYAPELDDTCTYDFYRRADRNGRRVLYGRLRHGSWCTDGIWELACDGERLRMWVYRTSGEYLENGTLTARP